MAPFARSHLWCLCAAISVGSQCVVTRFALRHSWDICAAISVGSQCVVRLASLVGTYHSKFARLGTDYQIMNQWVFAILKAMTTD